MLRRLNKKGQNTLEYVLLIAAVVAAFLAIQLYLNRSVQGKIRDSADSIADQFDAKYGHYTYTITTAGPDGADTVTVSLENLDDTADSGFDASQGKRISAVETDEITITDGEEWIEPVGGE